MENDLVPFRRLVLLTVALGLVAFGLVPAMASAAPLVASPTSLAFSTETVGKTSAPQTVTVSNPDPGVVQIVGVSILGTDAADFAISGESCGVTVLDEGQACTVEIAFAPQAGGSREAMLEVTVEGKPRSTCRSPGRGRR